MALHSPPGGPSCEKNLVMKKTASLLAALTCLAACIPSGTTTTSQELKSSREPVITPTKDQTEQASPASDGTTSDFDGGSSGSTAKSNSKPASSPQSSEPESTVASLGKDSDNSNNSSSATPTGTFTIAFAGDIHFEGRTKSLVTNPAPLTKAVANTVAAADFAIGNLETAITERGTPIPGKKYTFRAPAESVQALADAGFDVVSLANNHGADYGAVGLADTLKAKASAPIPMVGVGKDAAEAYAAETVTIDGVKTAVLGASLLSDYTTRLYTATEDKPGIAYAAKTEALLSAVKDARESHDLVIAFLHWGREGMTCPQARQVNMAKTLQAAGVDIMVGAHAHRVQGHGWMKDSYVGYGLGNFIWYHNRQPSSHTGVLTLTVDKARVAANRSADASERSSVVVQDEWTPMIINGRGVPQVVSGGQKSRLNQAVAAANKCSNLKQTSP